jgi:hypothetical protein
MSFETYSPNEATERGYISLTTPYRINNNRVNCYKTERAYFDRIRRDLQGTDSIIVDTGYGLEFWRHEAEMNLKVKEAKNYTNLPHHGL